jgi:hypothetical protein
MMDAAWSVQRPVRKRAATADHVRTQRLAQWKTVAARVRVQQGVRNITRRMKTCSPTEIRKDMATRHRVKLLVEIRDLTATKTTAETVAVAGTSPTAETKATSVIKCQSVAPPFRALCERVGFLLPANILFANWPCLTQSQLPR